MGSILNVKMLAQKEYTLIEGLTPELVESIGQLEDTFTCIIYGNSGHGKTNLTVQLLKGLKSAGDMLYVSFEEGHGKTMKDLVIRHNLVEELPGLKFSAGETIDELVARLKKPKSPKIVVLDSWQFSDYTMDDYKLLKRSFVFGKRPRSRKIFIIISHVKGKEPHGTSALEVKRDANIKIYVEGFIGFVISRYGSKKNYCIYEEGAKGYWGKEFASSIEPNRKEEKPKKERPPKKKEAPPPPAAPTPELFPAS